MCTTQLSSTVYFLFCQERAGSKGTFRFFYLLTSDDGLGDKFCFATPFRVTHIENCDTLGRLRLFVTEQIDFKSDQTYFTC